MKPSISYEKAEKILSCAFYCIVFIIIAVFAVLQPFGDPPDEINRFKVVQYICVHGTLPVGSDPEVLIGGYGASYAFQPILSYIIMGFVMRPVFFITQNYYILTYVARFVNVIFGVLMALYVRKISKEVFERPLTQWMFTLLVVFLPQNLFLHSYVNTDSMAALSSAIIIFACIRGLKTDWAIRSCITLAVGIILCALSYYNAYGIIMCSILLFIYSFIKKEKHQFSFCVKPFLRKGIFISVLVLFGIGWWFLRNAYLYQGDFLGMNARTQCAIDTCIPMFNPLTKETIQNTGHSITYLFTDTLFLHTLYQSFIATFGTMNIFTYPFIYSGYQFLFAVSLGCILLAWFHKKSTYLTTLPAASRYVFNLLMLLDMGIVSFLCIWYSYSWDYQPQGRYVLPVLIPLMYFISMGVANLDSFLATRYSFGSQIGTFLQWLVIGFVLISLFATILGIVIPYYLATPNWLDNTIQSLS